MAGMEKAPFELRILGSTELNGPLKDVDSLIRQPKRIALLAYLAMSTANGFRRRDQVIGFFWPELEQSQARTYFRKSLYAIREAFGEEVFTTRGEEELRVDSARLWCDAVALSDHLSEKRWSEALAVYRGELLEGLFPEGVAQEFQEWLSQQRRNLREGVAGAAWECSRLEEERGDRTAAALMARRARELDPDNEEGVRRLMGLLDRRGDRGGALRVYTEWQTRLLEEYGVEPDPETRKLARRVQAARKGESIETAPVPAPESPLVHLTSAQERSPEKPRTRIVVPLVTVMLLALFSSGAALVWRTLATEPVLAARSIAVLPLRLTGDTALFELAAVAADELTSALAGDSTIVVRSAVGSTDIVRQSRDVTELGRRLRVAYLVEGGMLSGPNGVRITLRLLRASDAVVLWTGTVDGDGTSTGLSAAQLLQARDAILERLGSISRANPTALVPRDS